MYLWEDFWEVPWVFWHVAVFRIWPFSGYTPWLLWPWSLVWGCLWVRVLEWVMQLQKWEKDGSCLVFSFFCLWLSLRSCLFLREFLQLKLKAKTARNENRVLLLEQIALEESIKETTRFCVEASTKIYNATVKKHQVFNSPSEAWTVHRPGLHLSVTELSTRSIECAKIDNTSPISVLITIAILGCILFFTLLSYVWGSFMVSQAIIWKTLRYRL